VSAPENPTPKPTLFLSYASEDRAAVRRLRDALGAAGLDVWYDENELGGGEAWDAKIRRQIRECDYFMPVISANTERRKEGYFRREWRLAVERTLDMADDVMFLLPVTLDGTSENSARVPEKFLTVQWLRAPDGALTPALGTLARRLAHGEHLAPQPPRGRTEPPVSRAAATPPPPHAAPPPPDSVPPPAHSVPPPEHDGPPPMPAFPKQHGQDLGGVLKFLAEVIWWIVTAIWLLLRRAPRWMRLIIVLWGVLSFISYCTRDRVEETAQKEELKQAALASLKKPHASETPPAAGGDSPVIPATPPTDTANGTKSGTQFDPRELDAQLAEAKKVLAESGLPASWAQFGTEVAGKLGNEIKRTAATGKHLVAVPFSVAHSEAKNDVADAIFESTWDSISDARPKDAALITTPLTEPSDAALVALGQRLKATYILGARVGLSAAPTPEEKAAAKLHISLLKVADGTLVWSGDFSLTEADAKTTGEKIAVEVLRAAPKP